MLDVLIVGAGISGISAACHLEKRCANKSYAVLEGRDNVGGTWDLFRYPGIRSDSDMHTFGFSFKPWTNPKSISDGESIRDYLMEAVAEYGVKDKIRFGH
ncbi:MAG: NAD(P)/FAD-dependent oxidoreductase, partial [Gammaproteobacteria bacterium]|nr:NAD(P)/FAD-dependent oxidoreductase [Gammaproteobacteria bacterium]